jgi:hypothetical protein
MIGFANPAFPAFKYLIQVDSKMRKILIICIFALATIGCDTSPPTTADAGFEARAHLTIEYDANYPTAVTVELTK